MLLLLLQQGGSPAEQVGSINSQILQYFQVILVLAGILILIYVLFRFWIPRFFGIKTFASGPVRVVARYPLEPKKTLYIVKTGPEMFLIGTSESQIHYLTALDAANIEPLLETEIEQPTPMADFKRILERVRKGRKAS